MIKYGRDEVSIVMTFVIGFAGGFYFFLTGYAPYVEQVKESVFAQDLTTTESLLITARQYGGCTRTGQCASFQLAFDGSFSYLPGSVLTGARPESGVIPRALLSTIRSVALPTRLAVASQASSAEDCISYRDGIDVTYEIVRNGELYILDSCTTTLRESTEIANALGAVWEYVGQ
jgi:hypothetical protein